MMSAPRDPAENTGSTSRKLGRCWIAATAGLVGRKPGDGRRKGAQIRLSVSAERTAWGRLCYGSAEPILARSAESSENRVSGPDALATGRISLAEMPTWETFEAGQASQRCHIHTITDGIRNNRRQKTLHESVEKRPKA